MNCKAHPDEKGTESLIPGRSNTIERHIARPIPMKRELKGFPGVQHENQMWPHCKAHPDEKGTERNEVEQIMVREGLTIARPIPMKRELKG